MKVKYEGTVGSYSFQMADNDNQTIEIWGFDETRPEAFIYLKEGSVKSQKDFDTEISYWYMQNVG